MLEIGFSPVNCLELRTLKYSSLQLGSSQVGMLKMRALQMKTLRISILICSRSSAEHGQDGLDIRAQPSFLVGSIESLVESVEAPLSECLCRKIEPNEKDRPTQNLCHALAGF